LGKARAYRKSASRKVKLGHSVSIALPTKQKTSSAKKWSSHTWSENPRRNGHLSTREQEAGKARGEQHRLFDAAPQSKPEDRDCHRGDDDDGRKIDDAGPARHDQIEQGDESRNRDAVLVVGKNKKPKPRPGACSARLNKTSVSHSSAQGIE
jgi:hypothetical protein